MAEFREANQSLVFLAHRDLRGFWGSLNLGGDPTKVREALLTFFPELLAVYGEASAVLGADWYDMLRNVPPSAARFRANLASPPSVEQAQATARWAIGPLFKDDPDPAGVLTLLMGSTQRLVRQPGRDSVFNAAAGDPVRTGVARVPRGLTTCRFCTMLASRGPVYRSEVSAELVVGRGSNRTGYDSAGKRLTGGIGGGVKARGNQPLAERFHDDCDCETVVIRSRDDYPEGYDPEEYTRLYEAGSGIGRDEPAGT